MGLRTMERRYSRFVGLPPQRVHTIARLLHACHLIRTARDLDLGAVAHRAGFYDHASFSNRFRELVGCSPSRFRAMEDVHYVELG
jgi:transcriptional regulator GlxA family with amidase domain